MYASRDLFWQAFGAQEDGYFFGVIFRGLVFWACADGCPSPLCFFRNSAFTISYLTGFNFNSFGCIRRNI